MSKVLRPSDVAALLAVIDPDAYTAAAYSSGWVAAKNYEKFLAVLYAGDLGSSATLDFKIQQATDSSGTGAKDITGKATTQLTQAGTDSNKQALINLTGEELDVTNGFDYIRITMTVAVATSDCGAALYGFNGRYAPASDNDVSTVDEIVA